MTRDQASRMLAAIYTVMTHPRGTRAILETQTRGMANIIRSATGGTPASSLSRAGKDHQDNLDAGVIGASHGTSDDIPTIHTHKFVDGRWVRQNGD